MVLTLDILSLTIHVAAISHVEVTVLGDARHKKYLCVQTTWAVEHGGNEPVDAKKGTHLYGSSHSHALVLRDLSVVAAVTTALAHCEEQVNGR